MVMSCIHEWGKDIFDIVCHVKVGIVCHIYDVIMHIDWLLYITIVLVLATKIGGL
jgi:hypothetical protein